MLHQARLKPPPRDTCGTPVPQGAQRAANVWWGMFKSHHEQSPGRQRTGHQCSLETGAPERSFQKGSCSREVVPDLLTAITSGC